MALSQFSGHKITEETLKNHSIFISEMIEDQTSHRFHVPWRSCFEARHPFLGEHHEHTACIVFALLLHDEPASLHPGDLVGRTAPIPFQALTQVTQAQRLILRFRQGDEDRELAGPEAGILLKSFFHSAFEVADPP